MGGVYRVEENRAVPHSYACYYGSGESSFSREVTMVKDSEKDSSMSGMRDPA